MAKSSRALSHVDARGRVKMVDVGEKPVTAREAIARGSIAMSREALRLIRAGAVKKGDPLQTARLAGISTARVTFGVFAVMGALTGFAAMLNSVRFNQIPSNSGLGLEMKVIASVVVGGTAITGGRGSLIGTVFGAILLGAIGPALTFLNVNAYWERAMQGGIILTAVIIDAVRAHSKDHGTGLASSRA